MAFCRRRGRQQKRAAAGDYHAPSGQRPALLGQRLQSTGTGYSRQRPAGKRQQQFTCASRQNESLIVQSPRTLGIFHQQTAIFDGHHARLRQPIDRRMIERPADASPSQRRRSMLHILTPDLATGGHLFIDQAHACTMTGGSMRGGKTRGSGTDDQHVIAISHRTIPACLRVLAPCMHAAGQCHQSRRDIRSTRPCRRTQRAVVPSSIGEKSTTVERWLRPRWCQLVPRPYSR